jgi:cyanate lyase
LQVNGATLKALIHEKLDDGIIGATNFKLDIREVDDAEAIRAPRSGICIALGMSRPASSGVVHSGSSIA